MATTERQSTDANTRERVNDLLDQSWLDEGMTREQLNASAQSSRRADEALGACRAVDEVLQAGAQWQSDEPEHGSTSIRPPTLPPPSSSPS